LRAAEAAADWARVSLKRAQELFDSKTVSQAELDSADAAVKQAEAQADNIRALIARKFVRAPFAGRLGIREISLGQYLNRGSPVVSLQAFDPVFVEFALPQQNLSQLRDGLEVKVTLDAFPGETFSGKVTALNPQVDPSTRNLRIQGTVPNADGRLRPGMFAEVAVVLPEKRDVVVVPLTAVLNSTHGSSVFTVVPGDAGPDGKPTMVARHVSVRTGEARGDFVVITEGLKGGERVVTAGAFKLRDGAGVFESPVGSTTPSLEPKTNNS
jgi:membrane fusion protein (multidrug efflux system)